MATKRIFSCDRCGKEWPEESNIYTNYPRHIDYASLKNADLCEECENEFHEVIRKYKETIRKEIP